MTKKKKEKDHNDPFLGKKNVTNAISDFLIISGKFVRKTWHLIKRKLLTKCMVSVRI